MAMTIHECPFPQNCAGGKGTGNCLEHTYGPKCMICQDGYTRIGFGSTVCVSCEAGEVDNSTVTLFIISFCLLMLVVSVVMMNPERQEICLDHCSRCCIYVAAYVRPADDRLSSAQDKKSSTQDEGPGYICIIKKCVLAKYKILISYYQVVTLLGHYYSVDYGTDAKEMEIVLFDLSSLMPMVCWFNNIDFYRIYMAKTIMPAVIVCCFYLSWKCFPELKSKLVGISLIYMFVIYPGISAATMNLFDCDYFENDTGFLKVDYKVDCYSHEYNVFLLYVAICVIIYPLGFPLLFFWLLYPQRELLELPREDGNLPESIQYLAPLAEDYEPWCWWYEVVECSRKVVLTSLSTFWFQEQSNKLVLGISLAAFYIVVFTNVRPLRGRFDNALMETSLWFISFLLLFGLCIRVSVHFQRTEDPRLMMDVLTPEYFMWLCVVMTQTFTCVLLITIVVHIHIELKQPRDDGVEGDLGVMTEKVQLQVREAITEFVQASGDIVSLIAVRKELRKRFDINFEKDPWKMKVNTWSMEAASAPSSKATKSSVVANKQKTEV